jgi:hypothetical protein
VSEDETNELERSFLHGFDRGRGTADVKYPVVDAKCAFVGKFRKMLAGFH